MKPYLQMELKRFFSRWQTMVAFLLLIGFFIAAYEAYHLGSEMNIDVDEYNAFFAFLSAQGWGPDTYLPLIFPLIMVLIAGDSLAWDLKSGFVRSVLMRTNGHCFILGKIFSVSVIGFGFMFIAEWIALAYSLFRFPIHAPDHVVEGISPHYATGLSVEHPGLYLLLIIVNTSLMSMAFVMFSSLLSLKMNQIFSVLIIPWFVYVGTSFAFELVGLNHFSLFQIGVLYLLPEADFSVWFIPLFWLGTWSLLAMSTYFLFRKRYEMRENDG